MSTPRKVRYEDLVAALGHPEPPHPPSLGYRLSLGLVAFLMLLLPLLYAAFVGAVGWSTVWWGLHGVDLVGEQPSWSRETFLFLAPLVTGAFVTLFLLKPFVARPAAAAQPRELDPEEQPLLFAYVEEIAERLGAPSPTRIQVDLQLNASASFRRPLLSGFDDDLVLTLGLPLVACARLSHLTGIVAHELGHFSQRAGMRAGYAIGWVTTWLHRGVHGRDAWDERLARWTRGSPHLMVLLLWLAVHGGIWVSRGALAALLFVARLASSHLARQQEFDADAHAVRLVGPEVVEAMLDGLAAWGLAEARAVATLEHCVERGRLPEDWPALVRSSLDRLSPKERRAAAERGRRATPHMYESHPPVQQRVEAARACSAQGDHDLDLEARRLLRGFPGLCTERTRHALHERYGRSADRVEWATTEELDEAVAVGDARDRVRREWFGPFASELLDLRLEPDAWEALETGRHVPEGEARAVPPEEREALSREVLALHRRVGDLEAARTLLDDGCSSVRAATFDVPDLEPETLEAALAQTRARLAAGLERARSHERSALARVSSVLRASAGTQDLDTVERRGRAVRALRAWRDLARFQRAALRLVEGCQELDWIADHDRGNLYVVRERVLRSIVLRLAQELGGQAYPFDHANDRATLRSVLVPRLPDRHTPGATHALSVSVAGSLVALVQEARGRLAEACAELEGEPGPDPRPRPRAATRRASASRTDAVPGE